VWGVFSLIGQVSGKKREGGKQVTTLGPSSQEFAPPEKNAGLVFQGRPGGSSEWWVIWRAMTNQSKKPEEASRIMKTPVEESEKRKGM